jgi:hypothetical protein
MQQILVAPEFAAVIFCVFVEFSRKF